jgi:hypothetical protein
MDHQCPPVLPLWVTPPKMAPQHAISCATTEAIANALEKPSSTQIILGALEEFAIGCISGIAGAALSLVQFSGLYWYFYILILPTLVLEILESYALFHAASHSPQSYTSAMHKAASKKRLSRQLFGQGVIVGQGALDLANTRDDSQLLSVVTLYATLWMFWILLCYISQSHPPVDKLFETGFNKICNEALERRHRGIGRNNSHSSTRSRRSTMISSAGSVGSCSLGSTNRRSMPPQINRSFFRRCPGTLTVPLGTPP